MEKKTIQINPEFLKFGGRSKTKRNRDSDPNKASKVAAPIRMKKPATNGTIRRHMMNHLRQQQEENYRKMTAHDSDSSNKKSGGNVKPIQAIDDFKSDFDKSLEYLEQVAKKVSNNVPSDIRQPLNKTSRSVLHTPSVLDKALNAPPLTSSTSLFDEVFKTCEDVKLDFPSEIDAPVVLSSAHKFMERPSYGCLKGGSLPTYRSWKSQTQRAYPSSNGGQPEKQQQNHNQNQTQNQIQTQKQQNLAQRHAEMRAMFKAQSKMNESAAKNVRAKKYLNQKQQRRILKRTFRVGKSKVHPRVSVLVSNQTMRQKVQQASANLKNSPIEEVRRFLVKKGLIRIGSTCPNDVLRKMYESSNLLCGELQNHSPDNLLYNYLNHAEL